MSYGQNYGGYGGYTGAEGYGAPPGAPPRGGYAPQYGSGGAYGGGPGLGTFPSPGGYAMPPGADPQLWNWFTSVDLDRSGAITPLELERALINGDWTPFDLDTIKLLMTIFDTDRNGTINFNEFSGLWKYIKDWQNVFRHFDKDRSGSIDGGELRDALAQFGFNLSPPLLNLVQRKYDIKASNVKNNLATSGISFDRFVRTCVVVKQLSESFGRLDTDHDGWIQISYEQFMQTVLTLP